MASLVPRISRGETFLDGRGRGWLANPQSGFLLIRSNFFITVSKLIVTVARKRKQDG